MNGKRLYVPPYAGEGPVLDYVVTRLKAIQLTYDSGQPEACLALLYSGIDTLGFRASEATCQRATSQTFSLWVGTYIVNRLSDIQGNHVLPSDLYAARCGILHTSNSESDKSRAGKATEILYRYCGTQSIRIFMNSKKAPICIDIDALCAAFKEGSTAWIKDVDGGDPLRTHLVYSRAENFMKWVMPG